MAVVKANAYGHGIVEVAKHLEKLRCDYFGVANVEEGVQLRQAGIKKPILVFTIATERQARLAVEHDLELTISSVEQGATLNRLAQKKKAIIQVHLKIDTGMNRIGIRPEGIKNLVRSAALLRRIRIKGVYTHFATADEKEKGYARMQLTRFQRSLEELRHEGVEPEMIHAANSAAILDLPESYFNMVRPGISIYGYYPSRHTTESIPLKPALTLKSHVSFVKSLHAGESVSYGRKFIARKGTTIVTIPIGYADGYSRLLSGKTSVLIHGKRFPVVGSICMDQLMVDVGSTNVRVEDEVVLIGKQGSGEMTVWHLADKMGTIPYEICTGISSRVPRTYTTL
jgi:alanine racemase